MKNTLIIIFLIISNLSFGQTTGYDLIAQKFYTKIDPMKNLGCCDSCKGGIKIKYEIPLYQYPQFDKLDLEAYENQVMDEGYIEFAVSELQKNYYELRQSTRNKITRSCFTIKEKYNIEHDRTGSGIYWVEGKLIVTFTFQGEENYLDLPWWKKTLYKMGIYF